jgi:hypothetical protein
VRGYLAFVFLFDVCEEGGVAEIGFAAGTLVVTRLDGFGEIVLVGIFGVHGGKQ